MEGDYKMASEGEIKKRGFGRAVLHERDNVVEGQLRKRRLMVAYGSRVEPSACTLVVGKAADGNSTVARKLLNFGGPLESHLPNRKHNGLLERIEYRKRSVISQFNPTL
jgi:hypothetical protein